MAQIPTIEQTTRAILHTIATYNVRAGEIVALMGIQMKLQDYRADDLNAALNDMGERGLIEPARTGFIKLTEAGFAEM